MEIKAKGKMNFDAISALIHLWMFKKADPKKRMCFWTIAYAILMAIAIGISLCRKLDIVHWLK